MECHLTRRRILGSAGLSAATATALGIGGAHYLRTRRTDDDLPTANRPDDAPPNVVLILADDLGREYFQTYGSPESYVGGIEQVFGDQGMRFTSAYSEVRCTPSRVKLLTGKSNIRNYMGWGVLDPRSRTLGHRFQSAGYRTAVAGKWQLSNTKFEDFADVGTKPPAAGFDRYCAWYVKKHGSKYYSPDLSTDGETTIEGTYGPLVCENFSKMFVRENRNRPFFLYYPLMLTHRPWHVPPRVEYEDCMGSGRYFDHSGCFYQQEYETQYQRLHHAMLGEMDAIVTDFVVYLDRLGLSKDTLVLFTTDNGSHAALESEMNGQTVSGGKGWPPSEPAINVPTFARWPGTVPSGSVCRDVIDFADITPTLGDVIGRDWKTADGRSFALQLRGQRDASDRIGFSYRPPQPPRSEATTPENFPTARYAWDTEYRLFGDGTLYQHAKDPLLQEPVSEGAASETRDRLQAVLERKPEQWQQIGRYAEHRADVKDQ